MNKDAARRGLVSLPLVVTIRDTPKLIEIEHLDACRRPSVFSRYELCKPESLLSV